MSPASASQKTALITGCSSGIGHALAVEFAERGCRVIATARSEKALSDLTALHENIIALPLEVHKPESVRALSQKLQNITGGRLDFLVNNAGIHYASTSLDIDAAKVRDLFEVNVIAVMLMCQAFAEPLKAAKGTIVQIGSVTRAVPMIWQSPLYRNYNPSESRSSK